MRTVDQARSEGVLVGPSTTIQEASAAMLDRHVEAVIVVDRAGVCGLVTAADVVRALADGRDATSTPVMAVARADAPLVRASEPLAEVHQRMRAAGHPLAVVLDDRGEPVGLLVDHEAGP